MFGRRAVRVTGYVLASWIAASLGAPSPAEARPSTTIFESGQVRPLALSPSGKYLFAVNTPDNRLEIFAVRPDGLAHRGAVPVGLEPVAVAARTDDEVWVVNHLSDSVSVVEVGDGGRRARVARTLLVGDEPRDLVFAGPGRRRAFITTAHRGQNIPHDPQLTTAGVGRADVWVFDALHLGASLGGAPLTIVTLFTDTPRALAVTPDGGRVYAAGFHSGNRTTVITELNVTNNPMGLAPPGPFTNFEGAPAPAVSLIVKWNGSAWVDELGQDWSPQVRLSLPDKDVHVIDAMASPPRQVSGAAGSYAGVGTILFNMVVNPVNGKVYVSNTEAMNHLRFEGPGTFAGQTLRGHLHESRITVLDPAGGVAPRHLNKHIDYAVCCAPVPNAESETSLAQPTEMAITRDGGTLYVAALGSSKIGVYRTHELEGDTFVPSQADQIEVSGGGPTGLVLDRDERRLFVMTRFDNAVTVIDTVTRAEIGKHHLYSPEPASVIAGRRFLYDARTSSSHGDSSCASCHVFGDLDSLAWDIGNPDAPVTPNPGPFIGPLINLFTHEAMPKEFHPMKGPTATQSLRGLLNAGPMHWRGDRTAGVPGEPSVQPDGGAFDERGAFVKFQVGFTDLLGRSQFIADADMDAFADFILQVTYPPNPIRALDDSLTPAQAAGRFDFFNVIRDGTNVCDGCHDLDPEANPGSLHPGFFGTSGEISFDFQPQLIKSPHLRNLYQKVGMFGMKDPPFGILPGDNEHKGDQVRGFGFLHDGSFDTVFRFMRGMGFSPFVGITIPEGTFPDNPDGLEDNAEGDLVRRNLESFLLAFDSNMKPIVGQQVTLSAKTALAAAPRIALLRARADAGDCDLVAKGTTLTGRTIGFVYVGDGKFQVDRQAVPPVPELLLRLLGLLPRQEITYTCAPPGSGHRVGIDRDEDGHFDGDEEDLGSDPADPLDTPTWHFL